MEKDYRVCRNCGKVLSSESHFNRHMETHDTEPKCCPYCRERYVHLVSLRQHIRIVHPHQFSYSEPTECATCKQVYEKKSLKAHTTTHSVDDDDDDDKSHHECVTCKKIFSTKGNLKIHSFVHADLHAKPFPCKVCEKTFVRERDYDNHMNSHEDIKPYAFEVCGAEFGCKKNYARHTKEHHGSKEFRCDVCGKRYHRHNYLIAHQRTTHSEDRPFVYTICGQNYKWKSHLNRHTRSHTHQE